MLHSFCFPSCFKGWPGGTAPLPKRSIIEKRAASSTCKTHKNQLLSASAAKKCILWEQTERQNQTHLASFKFASHVLPEEKTPDSESDASTAIPHGNSNTADFDSFLSSSIYKVVDYVDIFNLEGARWYSPMVLDFPTSFNNGCIGSVSHMKVFDALLEEFCSVQKQTPPDLVWRRFKFCEQRSKRFADALYSYKQALWYEMPLLTLCSYIVPNDEGGCSLSFVQPCLSLPFNSIEIQAGITMHMNTITNISSATLKHLAEFSHARRDLYTRHVVNGRLQDTDVDYFVQKFSKPGTGFVYTQASDGTILSLLTFACFKSTCKNNVVNILTTQADNQLAKRLCGQKMEKGLGDQMFRRGVMRMLQLSGGGVIYAECVTTGKGASVWKAHPIQESGVGNFLWLQLAMASDADLSCEPKTLSVCGVF